MPEDRTGLTLGNAHNRGLHAAARLDMESTTIARAIRLPGSRLPDSPLMGSRGPVSRGPETSHRLLPVQGERMAHSVWQKNRGILGASDAPEWLGLADGVGEDVELPLRFGIDIQGVGTSTGSRAGTGFGRPRTAGSGVASVAVIPLPSVPFSAARGDAPTHPLRRSTDKILRFRAPAAKHPIVVFSLVGGVGGTSLAAGLTRVLATCGERILLADAGGHSLLPHYFGGKGSRQGIVRKFVAPPESKSEVVTTLSLNVEAFAWNDEELDRILLEFHGESAQADRVVWDLGNAPAEWTARIMRGNARVIVPLLPTAKCMMQLTATEGMLQRSQKHGDMTRWQYVLNQYDDRDPAQMEMRKRFRAQLGERLLPFTLRSSPLVNEALLCGRTIVDHAPASPLVVDLWRLARSVAGLPQAYPEIVPGAWGES